MADGLSGFRRRDLLGSAALVVVGARALAAATIGSILAGCGSVPPTGLIDDRRTAVRVAAAYFGADAGDRAVALGSAYLEKLTPDLDPDVIDADLTAVIALIAGSMDEPAALAAVEDAVVADFRGGAMERLSGWSLGRTELRLCALLALQDGY